MFVFRIVLKKCFNTSVYSLPLEFYGIINSKSIQIINLRESRTETINNNKHLNLDKSFFVHFQAHKYK